MLAPNMVPSYITTGNKHKMTAPNKGTALRGCMDVPLQQTGTTAKTVSEDHPYKRERAMKPRRAALFLCLV